MLFRSTVLDAVGTVPMTITNVSTFGIGTIGGGDEATLTLTSAPSPAAKLVVASTQANGNTGTGGAANFGAGNLVRNVATLASPVAAVQNVARVSATGGTSKIWIAADTVGTYSGTVVIDNGTDTSTGTFSDRKSTRLNSSHVSESRMPSSA